MKKNIFVIIFITSFWQLHAAQINPLHIDVGGIKIAPDDMIKIFVKSADMLEENARKSRAKKLEAIDALELQLAQISRQKDAKKIGANEYEQLQLMLTKKIDRLHKELEEHDKTAVTIGNNIQNVLVSGWNTLLENYREEQQRKTQIAIAAASKAIENEGKIEQTRLELEASMEKLRYVSTPENLKAYALFLAASSVGISGGYYGVKYGYRYLEQTLEKKPALALETSYQSWWDRSLSDIYTLLGYNVTPPSLQDNIVFEPDLEEQLFTIAKITHIAHERGLPQQGVILYGPPGTGKTHFAVLLAHAAHMDYVITSADRFAQFSEGKDVEELHYLLDFAEKSPRGMLIFIDEIDALGACREKLSQQWIRLQNAFLARTGISSTKFKIIGATNRFNALDDAFLSRFPQKIEIPLPGFNERVRLINLYIKKYISEDKRTIKQNGESVEIQLVLDAGITSSYIHEIAQKLDGASGRMIEQTLDEIRSLTYLSDNFIVTKKICETVLQRKYKELQASLIE